VRYFSIGVVAAGIAVTWSQAKQQPLGYGTGGFRIPSSKATW
jgi:hypothetical protein